jgi:hypothetical protein
MPRCHPQVRCHGTAYSRVVKIGEIEPGRRYKARLTEDQATIWRGCQADVTVVRAGFHYDVEHREGSRVRGAPFVRRRQSEHPNGVEVTWDEQKVTGARRGFPHETLLPGRAIINARAVLHALDD